MRINDDIIVKNTEEIEKLRVKSKDVPLPLSKEDEELIEALHQYVVDSTDDEIAERENLKPAVGIAAIQIGIPKKMCAIVINGEEGEPPICDYALVNPKIVSQSVMQCYLKSGEGCLSVVDEHQGYIYRNYKIKVKAWDWVTKSDIVIQAKGYEAVVLQHEIDHLYGNLFYDHINKNDPFFEDPEAKVIE